MLDRADSRPHGDDDDREPRRQVSSERETVADPLAPASNRSSEHEAADDHDERDDAERLQALILVEVACRRGGVRESRLSG